MRNWPTNFFSKIHTQTIFKYVFCVNIRARIRVVRKRVEIILIAARFVNHLELGYWFFFSHYDRRRMPVQIASVTPIIDCKLIWSHGIRR